jgi:hypothetical protein
MTLNRSRWAAVGAAVAVTLGAGGLGLVNAAENNAESVFVPITNCRIFDTRSTEDVGPRQTPLGPDEEFVLEGQGETGNCNIPEAATALQLNVTAVNATETTHLTVFPSDADLPLASNLNPQLGHGTAYNAVTTRLSAEGQFTVYNLLGSIDVLADATGYFVPADMAPSGSKSVVLAVDGDDVTGIDDTADVSVLSTPMTAPAAGTVVVEAVASVTGDDTGILECSISGDATFDETSEQMVAANTDPASIALSTTVDVADAGDIEAHLVCQTTEGTANVHNPQLTLTFIPA